MYFSVLLLPVLKDRPEPGKFTVSYWCRDNYVGITSHPKSTSNGQPFLWNELIEQL